MRKMKMIGIAAAAGVMLLLSGCSGQSVTYDPNASQNAAVSSQAAAAVPAATSAPAAPTAALTPTSTPTLTPAVTVTATPTVTAKPTPTMAPTITPIEITPTVNPDAGLKVIGEKAEGSSIFKARIKNATNFSIVWFSVKDNFTDYYPANELEEDDSISNNETRVLYYDASHALEKSAEKEEKAEYLLRFALKTPEEMKNKDEEGHYYIIHSIPFSDLDEMEICFNDSTAVPYLRYKSKKLGIQLSTETEETAIYEEQRGGSDSSSGQSSEDASEENSQEGSGQEGSSQEGSSQEENSQERSSQEDGSEGNDNQDDGSQEEEQTRDNNEDVPEDVVAFDDNTENGGEEEYIDYGANEDEIIYIDETYDNEDAVG